MKSECVNELATALSKTQGEMKPAAFDKVNPHFKSKYASLASCWDVVRAPLAKNGLSVTQTLEFEETILVLTTTLLHSSGQFLFSKMPVSGSTPQQLGSSLTYVRRYSLCAILGIVSDDDDDGNAGSTDRTDRTDKNTVKPKQAAKAPQNVTDKTDKNPEAPKARFLGTGDKTECEPGDYLIPLGRLSGKKLSEVSSEDLSGILGWYESERRSGKVFGQPHLELIDYAERYLNRVGVHQVEDNIPF